MKNKLHPPFSPAYETTLLNTVRLLLSSFYNNPSLSLINETLKICYESIIHAQQKSIQGRILTRSVENRELSQIKDKLNEVYYDEQEDQAIIELYYRNLNFPEYPADELYSKLTELLTQTHTTQLSYSNSRKALHSWVDLREDGQIKSIYSGQNLNAQDVMEQDQRLETEAIQQMKQSLHKVTGLLDEHKEVLIESILRSLQFNIEHVIPQSWFKKRHPMVGDLHHLFTCEQDCNSFRSNIPYYDFDNYEPGVYKEIIRNSCGKRDGQEKFEPENGKGEIARATLYFLLRYPHEILPEKQPSLDVHLYKRWHNEHPVTLHEKHRNWAIYKLQGNRNPYIDFPELVFP